LRLGGSVAVHWRWLIAAIAYFRDLNQQLNAMVIRSLPP